MGVLTRQPKVPAFDVSGIVHLVGKGVTTLSPGDQVFGLCMNMAGNGCLQKYVTVPLNQGDCTVIRKPTSLDFVHAASIPLVFSTVHTALVKYGKLGDRPPGAKKRSVLVLGGSGGTGNVAIQLAKQLGCTVVTTCSQNNIDFVKKMGADEVSMRLFLTKKCAIVLNFHLVAR
jgi:NADPH:quinone reductase-like Zn-dependent oxidoreductase